MSVLFCANLKITVSNIGRHSFQYVWYFSFSGIYRTATCLLINIWVVNQRLSEIFLKFIKVSSLFRIYFILKYAFISVHALYKTNTRIDSKVVPHALFKTIWKLFPPSCHKSVLLSTDYCIWNDQKQLQDNWTCITNQSPAFSLLMTFRYSKIWKKLTSS